MMSDHYEAPKLTPVGKLSPEETQRFVLGVDPGVPGSDVIVLLNVKDEKVLSSVTMSAPYDMMLRDICKMWLSSAKAMLIDRELNQAVEAILTSPFIGTCGHPIGVGQESGVDCHLAGACGVYEPGLMDSGMIQESGRAKLIHRAAVDPPAPTQPPDPAPLPADICCRIGGEKWRYGKPCPLHATPVPWTGDHDTFDWLKP